MVNCGSDAAVFVMFCVGVAGVADAAPTDETHTAAMAREKSMRVLRHGPPCLDYVESLYSTEQRLDKVNTARFIRNLREY